MLPREVGRSGQPGGKVKSTLRGHRDSPVLDEEDINKIHEDTEFTDATAVQQVTQTCAYNSQ